MHNVKIRIISQQQMNASPVEDSTENNNLGKFWISCLKDVMFYVDLTFSLKEDLQNKKKRKKIKICNTLIMTLLDFEVSGLVSFLVV